MRHRLPAVAVLFACAFTLRAAEATYYQIELVPTGKIISTDLPVTKGTMVVFHKYPDGSLVSMRRADLKTVTRVDAEAVKPKNPADAVIRIGNLAMQGGSAQAGATNARAVSAPKDKSGLGTGFYSDIIPGQTQAYRKLAQRLQGRCDVRVRAVQRDAVVPRRSADESGHDERTESPAIVLRRRRKGSFASLRMTKAKGRLDRSRPYFCHPEGPPGPEGSLEPPRSDPSQLNVNRVSLHRFRCFVDRLGERGVGVDGLDQFL